MKSKDLRIGNLVLNTKGNVDVINLEALSYISKETYHQVNPIPLTEEWLLKFGFDKIGRNFELKKVAIWHNVNTEIYFFRFGLGFETHINSIHQLQNLYFALTNEELEITNK
jgi:hypothetical protein